MKKNDKITVITCAAAFALNVALFSVKLYVGLCANSISIYSDAVNNMFDSLSGLAAFICFAALLSSSSEGTRAIIKKAEQFFSFVMSVNYLAVMVCPFIVDLFRHVFGTHSDRFPFFFNAALVLAVAVVTLLRRGSFTLGLDESYYRN